MSKSHEVLQAVGISQHHLTKFTFNPKHYDKLHAKVAEIIGENIEKPVVKKLAPKKKVAPKAKAK
jgi:hypothetical protein